MIGAVLGLAIGLGPGVESWVMVREKHAWGGREKHA